MTRIVIHNMLARDASGAEVVETKTNSRGHKVRLQKRAGKWDVIYNDTGLSWRYKKKGVSEQEARAEFDYQAMDGVGTPEEIAYGEGWHSTQRGSPYDDPKLTAAFERGRKAKEQASKLRRNGYMGEVRGKRFEPPRARQQDFVSEQGYVAKIINAKTGGILASSEAFIRPERAKEWAKAKALEFIKQGKRISAELHNTRFDPGRTRDHRDELSAPQRWPDTNAGWAAAEKEAERYKASFTNVRIIRFTPTNGGNQKLRLEMGTKKAG